VLKRWAAAGVLLTLTVACASNRKPSPTLDDYSDGVSTFVDGWFAHLAAGKSAPDDYAVGFRGMEVGASPNARRIDLGAIQIRVEEERPGGTADLDAARFGEEVFARIVAPFSKITRRELTILKFERRGTARDAVLRLFLAGTDRQERAREETGQWQTRFLPAGDGWKFSEIRQLSWLSASASTPLFEDETDAAGLTHIHRAALPNASRNIPVPGEHMPPGVAVLDFDGDGRDDLFVAGGDGNHLYRNNGDGTFADVAEKAGVAGWRGKEATGALAFDYDNDGRPDLYVCYLDGPNLLFHNRGDGTFEEVGERAGVSLKDWCTSAAAFDYDRDGFADLYVLVYGRPDHGPNLQADNALPNHLFHNNGDGTFTDVTKQSKTGDKGWGLAVSAMDADEDGWPDLYIANDFGKNDLYRNNRDGTFTNIAKKAGVTDAGFGMGVAVADYDGDGHLDFYVSNYSFPANWFLKDKRYPMPPFPYSIGRPLVWRRLTQMSRGSSLFRFKTPGRFERASNEAGVWDTSWSWGCQFIDSMLRGRPDIFVVNGMVTGKSRTEHEIEFWNMMSREYMKFEKGIPIGDFGDDSLWGHPPKRFYVNLDGKHFADLAAISGLESDANQRGLVVLDANGDGVPDLFAAGFLQKPALWINKNPDGNRALAIRLIGDSPAPGGGSREPGTGSRSRFRSTRDALGAVVTVEANGLTQTQLLVAGNSFLSSSTKTLYFGLGKNASAERVIVKWPDGKRTERTSVPAGAVVIREGEEIVR
jgi:enediyne biosynthesis protein E4